MPENFSARLALGPWIRRLIAATSWVHPPWPPPVCVDCCSHGYPSRAASGVAQPRAGPVRARRRCPTAPSRRRGHKRLAETACDSVRLASDVTRHGQFAAAPHQRSLRNFTSKPGSSTQRHSVYREQTRGRRVFPPARCKGRPTSRLWQQASATITTNRRPCPDGSRTSTYSYVQQLVPSAASMRLFPLLAASPRPLQKQGSNFYNNLRGEFFCCCWSCLSGPASEQRGAVPTMRGRLPVKKPGVMGWNYLSSALSAHESAGRRKVSLPQALAGSPRIDRRWVKA